MLAFSRVISYNAPLTVVRVYTNGNGGDADRASEAVQTLLFSKQLLTEQADLNFFSLG